MQMNVAQAIVKCLEVENISLAFGITGSHFLPFFKALKDSSISFISVKHEGAAGYLALNYTKASQVPALLLGTAGPGAANLVGGIAEMCKAQIPGVIITPLVASSLFGKNAFQEDSGFGTSYSINSVMQSITRKSISALRPDQIPHYMRDLLRTCLTAPFGPVHLAVPSDFFDMEIEFDEVLPQSYRLVKDERIEIGKIKQIADELSVAKKPLLLIGNRCIYPDCSSQLQAIIDTWNLPFVMTHGSKGILAEDHDLCAGVLDYFGHKSAEWFCKQSDCIFAIGMDFSEAETLAYDPDLFKNGKIFALDSDSRQFASALPVSQCIAGSIPSSLDYLLEQMKAETKNNMIVPQGCKNHILEMNKYQISEMAHETSPMKIEFIINEIAKAMPKKGAVYTDIGASSFSFIRHFTSARHGFYASSGNYSMGQGVAGCIGGKLANRDKFVVGVCGDGSFLMHGNEVMTAVQYALGITWIVFVEEFYNMIQINQCLAYGGDLEFCTKIKNPDFSKLAEAYGIRYYEIKTKDDIAFSIKNAHENNMKNESALITVSYAFDQHLPIKPQLVRSMKNMGQTKDIQSNPYLMKAFAKAIKEKG